MDLLIIILGVVIIAVLRNIGDTKPEDQGVQIPKEKVCPPHKWRFEEIKDHEGTVHATKLVCDICGPMKPQEDIKREAY